MDSFDEQLARQNLRELLHGLSEVGGNKLAEHLGVSDAKVSSMKTDVFPMIAKATAFMNIQVRSANDRCFTDDQIARYDVLVEFGKEYLAKYPRMSDTK